MIRTIAVTIFCAVLLSACGMDQSKTVCDPPTEPGGQSYCHKVK